MASAGDSSSDSSRRSSGAAFGVRPPAHQNPWLNVTLCEEVFLKVVIVGGPSAGKTAILAKYLHGNRAPVQSEPTIGFDLYTMPLSPVASVRTPMHMEFWDVSHTELFGPHLDLIFENVAGVIVVADLFSFSSIQTVDLWRAVMCRYFSPKDVPMALLLNKKDVSANQWIKPAVVEQYAKEAGFRLFRYTSARTGGSVKQVMDELLQLLLHNATELDRANLGKSTSMNTSMQQQSPAAVHDELRTESANQRSALASRAMPQLDLSLSLGADIEWTRNVLPFFDETVSELTEFVETVGQRDDADMWTNHAKALLQQAVADAAYWRQQMEEVDKQQQLESKQPTGRAAQDTVAWQDVQEDFIRVKYKWGQELSLLRDYTALVSHADDDADQ